uniref:Uncharacterized protein n=1 Tax=Octopus bimaculoides TaxID=37653 RepID=A0A0L8GVR5_OCTBM
MMMINHIAILIFLSSIVISASQKWTYKNKLGQTEYCCFCYYDFRTENTIQECLSKNKNDTRRPFCICNKGKLPKCPESTTICNRQIACPENLAYQICKVPFLDDAKLVCNDSLLWEAHFTCPGKRNLNALSLFLLVLSLLFFLVILFLSLYNVGRIT